VGGGGEVADKGCGGIHKRTGKKYSEKMGAVYNITHRVGEWDIVKITMGGITLC